MQSADYVPGVSGWKMDKCGNYEFNSAKITAEQGGPRLITVTAGEWPDSELPSNGIERYAFIGAELAKIPAEYRDSAEFSSEDISFDRDGSDYRTTLTYKRRETADEVAERLQRAKTAGTRISLAGGVLSISHDGVLRAQFGDLHRDENPQPFVIVDGVTYMNEALIKDGTIGATVIVTESSARASADEAMCSRIGALETRMGSLALEALAIKGDIDAAAALNRK